MKGPDREGDLFVLVDGMCDEDCSSMGYAQAFCDMPGISAMGIGASGGFFETATPGFEVDTASCVLRLMGLGKDLLPKGRAFLEAKAFGIPANQGDLLLRGNLCVFDGEGMGGRLISPNAAGLCEKDCRRAGDLADKLCEGADVFHMSSYRYILRLCGQGQAGEGLVTFPPHQNPKSTFGELMAHGAPAAGLINSLSERSFGVLSKEFSLPCAITAWGQSGVYELPSFASLHENRPAMAVASVDIVRGLASALSIPLLRPEGATGDTDTDLGAKCEAALCGVRAGNLVLLHVNGADEAAHRKDPGQKRDFLARFDNALCDLIERLPDASRVLVTADHVTSPYTGSHQAAPQPFVLAGKGAARGIDFGLADARLAVDILTESRSLAL